MYKFHIYCTGSGILRYMHTYVYVCVCNGCNMAMRDLPDMLGHTYQASACVIACDIISYLGDTLVQVGHCNSHDIVH